MITVAELTLWELEDCANAILADYEQTNGEPIEGPVSTAGPFSWRATKPSLGWESTRLNLC